MRFSTCILTLSSLAAIVSSAPFLPQNGDLQSRRRRAVDYPVVQRERRVESPQAAAGPVHMFNKRALPSYSVVPVDGVATSTSTPTNPAVSPTSTTLAPTTPAEIIIKTVNAAPSTITIVSTAPPSTTAPATSVETLIYTSVVTANALDVPSSITTPTATEVIVETQVVTSTQTAAPSPSSTHYYDDGMWHTFYPVQSWETSTAPSPSSTQYYDDGLWHTSYPVKSLTTSMAPTSDATSATSTSTVSSATATASPAARHRLHARAELSGEAHGKVEAKGQVGRARRWTAPGAAIEESWGVTRTEYDGAKKFMK